MRLTAIEADQELAQSLRARLWGTNVEVVNGDATTMSFQDAEFSGCAAFTMLRQHARGGREPSQLADIELAAAQTLNHVWHGASVQIFNGWLESIIQHKARGGRLKT